MNPTPHPPTSPPASHLQPPSTSPVVLEIDPPSHDQKVAQFARKIKHLESTLREAEQNLQQSNTAIDQVRSRLRTIYTKLVAAQNDTKAQQVENGDLKRQIQNLTSRIRTLERLQSARKEELRGTTARLSQRFWRVVCLIAVVGGLVVWLG